MCGIAGTLGRSDPALIQALCIALQHRGPDDSGMHVDDAVILGMRRLSILDLSESGHQPMTNEDGSIWLVYNGEVYNYRELARDLIARGHTIRSSGDTEVLIHAYEEYGTDFIRRLNGMFAFALWDRPRQRLLLARDRLGIKPLHYTVGAGHTLTFASEVKALLQAGAAAPKLRAGAVSGFLFGGASLGNHDFIDGVESLPPGSFMLAEPGRAPHIEAYWSLHFATEGSMGRGAAVEAIQETMASAVRDHMISDVPVGLFLSGGVDSALIGALTAREVTGLRSYSIGFKGNRRFDETQLAEQTAARIGTRHQSVLVDERHVADRLPRFIEAMDQPTHDGLNVFLVSEFAARDLKVVLSGLGGDELFAGYSTFKFAARLRRLRRLFPQSDSLGRVAARAHGAAPPAIRSQWISRMLLGMGGAYRTPVDEYWLVRNFFGLEEVERLLAEPEFRDAGTTFLGGLIAGQLEALNRSGAQTVIDEMMMLEITSYMRSSLLADADSMSMSHSLELRVPFLDARLVDLVTNLPPNVRSPETFLGKRLLLDAFDEFLSPELRSRPKRGFALPLPVWMREGRILEIVQDCLSEDSVRARGLLNPEVVAKHRKAFFARPYGVGNQGQLWLRVWMLTVLELWVRAHLDRVPPVRSNVATVTPGGRSDVLLLSRVFPPKSGGVERMMFELHSRLADKYHVDVVAPAFRGAAEFDTRSRIRTLRTRYLGDRYKASYLPLLLAAIGAVRRQRHPLVVCDQADTAIIGLILKRLFHTSYVVFAYGAEFADKRLLRLKRRALREAACVIGCSADSARRAGKFADLPEGGCLTFVYPGVDAERFTEGDRDRGRERWGLQGKRVLLTVARLDASEAYKGHDVVIRALPKIAQRFPDVAYLIVGDGTLRRRLEILAGEVGMAGNVVFTGNISDSDIPDAYAASDLMVMVSHESNAGMTEGFGIVYLEAAAAGLPVVYAPSGGAAEAVIDLITGLAADPHDISDIADKVCRLLAEPALASQMGAAGYRRVLGKFTWNRSAERYGGILEALSGG